MSTLATRFSFSFFLALSAAPVPGQGPTYDVPRSYALGTDGATLGRSVSGDVTGDLLPDLVLRSGTGALMLVNPGCLDKVVTVPAMGPIHDIAILSAVPALGSARLAIASELEIALLSYSPCAPPGLRWSSVVVPDPLAANAARLRSADIDGSGTDDLIVVLADQRTLRYELHLGNGVFMPLAGFTMPQDVVDVAAVELDGDPGDELAILATNGVHLRQPDGTWIGFVRNATPIEDAMVVLRHPGYGNRVLFTTRNNDGSNLLIQIGAGGFETSWNLGLVHPVSIQVADYDHDGDADLLMTETNPGTLRILLNDHMNAGVPTFSIAPGQVREVTVSSPVAGPNAANARWFDANLDGELDLFLGITATSEVRGLIGNALAPPPGNGPTGDGVPHPMLTGAAYLVVESPNAQPTAHVRLELNPVPNGPYTHMEITVWIHRWNSIPELLAEPRYVDLGLEPMSVTVDLDEDHVELPLQSRNRYYMTVRKVTMGLTTITASGAVYAAGFCGGDTNPEDPETTLLRNDSDPAYEPIPYENMRSSYQDLGLFVPMPRVPHFVPGID